MIDTTALIRITSRHCNNKRASREFRADILSIATERRYDHSSH